MSKAANAGELRTPVIIKSVTHTIDADGFPTDTETNVFTTGTIMCKWVNAHGSDALRAMELQLREPATLTCRYSSKINERCLVYRGSDPVPYEIISIDNVENRNTWLEIKVQRKVEAR